jgi:hypothetical protein
MKKDAPYASRRLNGRDGSKCGNAHAPRRRAAAQAEACGSGGASNRSSSFRIPSAVGWLSLCVSGWGIAGCSATDPLAAWQKSLTRTVEVHGHGDPNVLRDLPGHHGHNRARPARITFAELGVPGAGIRPFVSRSDVRGVLVGQAPVDSELWFVFVVGVVDTGAPSPGALRDVRLAALAIEPGGLRWRVGERHPAPLARYAALSERKNGIARTFPSPIDIFDMELAGGAVTLSERHTGASWRLNLRGDSTVSRNRTAAILRDAGQ